MEAPGDIGWGASAVGESGGVGDAAGGSCYDGYLALGLGGLQVMWGSVLAQAQAMTVARSVCISLICLTILNRMGSGVVLVC